MFWSNQGRFYRDAQPKNFYDKNEKNGANEVEGGEEDASSAFNVDQDVIGVGIVRETFRDEG